jgi:acylpyruvate hydrolase
VHFLCFRHNCRRGLAASRDGTSYRGRLEGDPGFPGFLDTLIQTSTPERESAGAALLAGDAIDLDAIEVLQPLRSPGKIICVGLNYRDHAAESGMVLPDYPTLFARFASSLIAHDEPIIRPIDSDRLDDEGQLVAVIGKGGRRIPLAAALDHVAGCSIFNDGSIRDFQLRTSQWTVGKNFEGTGSFGPVVVTTDDLIFDVATLVSLISASMTLSPGDLIVTGTPSGVGAVRKPPVCIKAGDVCEIEIERIGALRNRIVNETTRP